MALAAPDRAAALGLHDSDPDLLELAGADLPGPAGDGEAVTVETRLSDVTQLGPDDLAGAALVTASALLDLLTADELAGMIRACAGAGCPMLLMLSVIGRVQLAPADPLDSRVAAAFDVHQRRMTPRGRLLGPDAVDAAVQGFRRLGAEVIVRQSPWRLGAAESGLAASGSPDGSVLRASKRPGSPPTPISIVAVV